MRGEVFNHLSTLESENMMAKIIKSVREEGIFNALSPLHLTDFYNTLRPVRELCISALKVLAVYSSALKGL